MNTNLILYFNAEQSFDTFVLRSKHIQIISNLLNAFKIAIIEIVIFIVFQYLSACAQVSFIKNFRIPVIIILELIVIIFITIIKIV